MENVILHILIEILTPFIVYLLADILGVSAILAVFSAGIAHSFNRKKLNPEKATLNVASDSIWGVLSFTLEGLVFVILGTQLPDILRTVQTGEYAITTPKILLYILILTLIFTLSRFLWSYFTIPKKSYTDAANTISKLRASVIFSLSGARGAVTLAIVMSIPVLLNDGSGFPQRNLIILIATGVILCSLLLTNFVLPLLVEKESPQTKSIEEKFACIEILQNVIKELSAEMNDDNRRATQIVIREYLHRISSLHDKKTLTLHDNSADKKILAQIYEWEMQNINSLYEKGEIDQHLLDHYLDFLRIRFNKIIHGKENPFNRLLKKRFSIARYIQRLITMYREKKKIHQHIFILMKNSNQMILEKLRTLRQEDDNPTIDKFIFYYEFSAHLQRGRGSRKTASEKVSLDEIASYAFQLERDHIRIMLEQGHISRETAKEMRNNIVLLETQIEY
jgi:CPA1 family monovalent cation:H+ antiporter